MAKNNNKNSTPTECAANRPLKSQSSVAQRPLLKRTMLFAGVFALLAMIYIPGQMHSYRGEAHGGSYHFIFDQEDTGVGFFQLLVNVAFAAGLGAVIGQLSRRVVMYALWVLAALAATALLVFGSAAIRAHNDEEYAVQLRKERHFDEASGYFHNAAVNWRIALRTRWAQNDDAQSSLAKDTPRREAADPFNPDAYLARKRAASPPSFDPRKPYEVISPDGTVVAVNPNSDYPVSTDPTAGLTAENVLGPPSQQPSVDLAVDATAAQKEKRQREEDLCNKPLHVVPWHHQTTDGKTFMCADFYERRPGDRKGELDEAVRQIKARFYREDLKKRKKEGGIYHVIVYFYK